jgi:molybdopterin synthase catalytic subunit
MPNEQFWSYYYLASLISARAEDSFAIAFAPLSLEEVYALADEPGNGAVVVMSGMVRNQPMVNL